MFKGLGQFGDILKLLQNPDKVKEEMQRWQQRLAQITAEGDAGGGMVRVKANGKLEVLSCSISEEAMRSGDRELLEDLIKSAVNQAVERARLTAAEETAKMSSALGLPAGMGLPGVPGLSGPQSE
jgi:DNA-binding YbaB/EbfC family protein